MSKIKASPEDRPPYDVFMADDKERQRLWKIRRSISAANSCFPIRGDGKDLVVPRTRIPDIIGKMDGICEKYGLFAINFGHA
ncbi:MAG: FAD-linked oxidase C-terminal domain-containing protein, partial [Desulfobacterium sp.]